jgi:predicted DNA-binding protein
MSSRSLRLPDSLHNRVRVLSKKDRISINQFVATAVAKKIAALETEDYIAERAQRASREKYDAALDQVPDGEPDDLDRLP